MYININAALVVTLDAFVTLLYFMGVGDRGYFFFGGGGIFRVFVVCFEMLWWPVLLDIYHIFDFR
jgi:hypothetical protein